MVKRKEKWFNPKGHCGFRTTLTVKGNLRAMKVSSRSRPSHVRKRLRQVNALANVTQDKPTERRARQVVRMLSGILAKKRPSGR